VLERPNKIYENEKNKENGKELGSWTMIYDEGFELHIKDYTFFSFSKYRKVFGEASNSDTCETPDYINICNQTFLGK